jgi:hypothetical protein
MNQRLIAVILLIVGLALAVLSLAADPLGLGEGAQFGYKQIIGLALGAAGVVAGLVLLLRKSNS